MIEKFQPIAAAVATTLATTKRDSWWDHPAATRANTIAAIAAPILTVARNRVIAPMEPRSYVRPNVNREFHA